MSQTLIFDEEANRFETFAQLYPEMMVTLGTTLCSFTDGVLYTHDDEPKYNNFFGVQYDSYITGVFNKAAIDKKTFMAIEEKASQVWVCPEIETTVNSYGSTKQLSNLVAADFEQLEGNYNAALLNDQNSIGGIIEGDSLKGNVCTIKLKAVVPDTDNNIVSLSQVILKSINSPLNVR